MIEKGFKAPNFRLPDHTGKIVELEKLKGKTVALMFYPKDKTPGCTLQACTIRDSYTELTSKGVVVLGINEDDAKLHSDFISEYKLPHTLLTDSDRSVMVKYGAWGTKNMYGRIYEGIIRRTILVDPEGNIQHVFKRPKTKEHAMEILKVI